MKKIELGKSGIIVSQIAIGSFGLGGGQIWSDMKPDVKLASDLFDAAIELGVNYIDSAPVYGIGNSEKLVGEALKGRRDKFVLQTKCGLNWRNEGGEFEYVRDGITVNRDLRPSAIRKDVEDSLERLQTDYLDIVVTHRQQSAIVPIEETVSELLKLKQEGKIRAFGISNSTKEELAKYSEITNVALVQENFNILTTNNRNNFKETCEKVNTTFQCFNVLAKGALTGKNPYTLTYEEGDARNRMPWFKEPIKSDMLKLMEKWEGLASKYNCSIANLVINWTSHQFKDMSLLTGFRRVETLTNTVKGLEINIDKEDLELMEQDVMKVLEKLNK